MISTNDLSELLANLYTAPLEPQKWQSFLDRLCALTQTASGYMLAIDPEQGNVTLAGGGLNFAPETLRLYNEHYGPGDPYAGPAMANPRVGVIQGEELVSRSDLYRSELYNELLNPFDLEHMALLSCNSPEQAGLFALWRSPKQGPLDVASIRFLETLIPHVQTALKLRTKVMDCDASNLFSETALDAMSIAAFLVTSRGRVQHMNQLAAAYVQSGDCLLLQDGKLTASDSHASAELELLIAGAASSGRICPEAAPGGGIRLSRLCTQTALQVSVIPAPEHNQLAGCDSFALVFVNDPSVSPKPRSALMQQLYGLTPTEVRVANLLLEGIEVREAAERLSMALETCRFHVKRVMAKTGTHRQTELMRLMLSLPGRP